MKKLNPFFIYLIPTVYLVFSSLFIHSQEVNSTSLSENDCNEAQKNHKPEENTEGKPTDEENGLLPPEQEEDGDIASRDRYDLYDRNRDRGDWDVRTNWDNQKESYFEGNTKLNQMGPRYSPEYQHDDEYHSRNRGW